MIFRKHHKSWPHGANEGSTTEQTLSRKTALPPKVQRGTALGALRPKKKKKNVIHTETQKPRVFNLFKQDTVS